MERKRSIYCKITRAETVICDSKRAKASVARMTVEGTMGHGGSQIGYLANYINLYGGHALRPAVTQPSLSGSLYAVGRICRMN